MRSGINFQSFIHPSIPWSFLPLFILAFIQWMSDWVRWGTSCNGTSKRMTKSSYLTCSWICVSCWDYYSKMQEIEKGNQAPNHAKYLFFTDRSVQSMRWIICYFTFMLIQCIAQLTWGKKIFLHSVPVVQESKEVVPICAPEGADCRAIQFISMAFEPSLYS